MYYIIENQFRPDGIINSQPIVTRQNVNSALSYFWDRCSKMSMNDTFTSVSIVVLDENFNEVERKIVKTMYVAPTAEPTEPIAEAF